MRVIKLVYILLIIFTFEKGYSNVMVERNNQIKKTWILNNSQMVRAWSTIILPDIMDFSLLKDSVLVMNYKEENVRKHRYHVNNDIVYIGGTFSFQIKEVSKYKLKISIKGEEFSYQPLIENNDNLVAQDFIDTIETNKWQLGSDIYEFTGQKEDAFSVKIKILKLQSKNKKEIYYGIYNVDIYKGNIFLIFLVDGRYKREVFKITCFTESIINATPVDNRMDKHIIDLKKIPSSSFK